MLTAERGARSFLVRRASTAVWPALTPPATGVFVPPRAPARLSKRGARVQPRVLATALVGLLLGCVALAQLVWSFRYVAVPRELEYGEAIIYGQAARLLHGQALYQSIARPPYTITAYTPLYYVLAAALQALCGPGFGPGRVLSLCAGLSGAALVCLLTKRCTKSWWAGAFAAAVFVALGLPWLPWGIRAPWSALYKEDVLGVALSLGAIYVLGGGSTARRCVLAAALVALAVLTKQTLIAAGLAGTIWIWRQDHRRAALFVAVASGIVGLTSAAFELTSGAFIANVVLANANPARLDALENGLWQLAAWQVGPLLAALLFLKRDRPWRRGAAAELIVLYWLAALLPLVGLAKVGSNYNYWTELAAATAVLATAAIWTSLQPAKKLGSAPRTALVPLAALAATPMLWLLVGILGPTPAAARPAAGDEAGDRVEQSATFAQLVARVRAEPKEVLAEPMDVVALADRPIAFEPYVFAIMQRQGQWDDASLVRRICDGEVGMVVLGYPLEQSDSRQYEGFTFWPPRVIDAITATATFEGTQSGRYVYALAASKGADAPVCRAA